MSIALVSKMLKVSDEDVRRLQATPIWKACVSLALLIQARSHPDDIKIIAKRLNSLAFKLIQKPSEPSGVQVTTAGCNKAAEIKKQAMSKGWTEFELFGNSNDYRIASFSQLFIEGSKVTSIEEDVIVLQLPSGYTQNVHRHHTY